MTRDQAVAHIVQARNLLDKVGENYEGPGGWILSTVMDAANECDVALEEFKWNEMQERIKEDG